MTFRRATLSILLALGGMAQSLPADLPAAARNPMEFHDDELTYFEAHGAPLPTAGERGYVDHEGARIQYATYGSGAPVILLHGGNGHSGNWSYQIPAVVKAGYRAVLIDTRGHGRSTRDARPYTYELLASDVLAVMDTLRLEKATIVGWSDGAATGLVLAKKTPARVAGVFFFVCNMDPSGTKKFEMTPTLGRCFARHRKDYMEMSATPDQFDGCVEAVGLMQRTDHNFSSADLSEIRVPVSIVHGEQDEFIKREHSEYLARTIPGAEFVFLPGVSHFAPLQRPEQFNRAVIFFLRKVLGAPEKSGS